MDLAAHMSKLPSVGFVTEPSPLTALPGLAQHAGLTSLTVKRDDLLPAHHGGNKVRKLDVLLATPPFRDAPRFASLGAIGSGHLVACAEAAQALGKSLDAYTFHEPISAGVLENLAFTASHAASLDYSGSRLALGLRHRGLLLSPVHKGVPVIPPGGTLPAAVAGIAKAGFELAAQVEAGQLPRPTVIYCALGTGGTAAGLALGLGLAGFTCELRAVATVERLFTSARTVRHQIREAASWLRAQGIDADAARALKVKVIHGQLGPGYGVPTAQSLAAVEVLRHEGVPLEPVYTGKAFAALLADAAASRLTGDVLFWNTVRRGPLPASPDWRSKLPEALQRTLRRSTSVGLGRRVVLAGGLAAAGLAAVARLTGYPAAPGWAGQVLMAWEAHVLAASAEVLCGATPVEGLTVAANVDRFLVAMPPNLQAEIHQLMALVEHGTGLGLRVRRFTRLDPDAREAFLLSLGSRGWLLAQAFRGLRDLCLMGTYQDPRCWTAIGYKGPWPETSAPELVGAVYESVRAAKGQLPRGAVEGTR